MAKIKRQNNKTPSASNAFSNSILIIFHCRYYISNVQGCTKPQARAEKQPETEYSLNQIYFLKFVNKDILFEELLIKLSTESALWTFLQKKEGL